MRPEPWSLERRLRTRLLLALAALWLLASSTALYVQWLESNEVLDAAQEEIALTLLRLPTPASSDATLRALPQPETAHGQATLMQVYSLDGQLIWRSTRAPDRPMAPLSHRAALDQGDWRIVVRPVPALDRVAIVAASLHDRREALTHSIQALLLPLLALLPLAAVTVTWLLRGVFQRLDRVRQDLRLRGLEGLAPLPDQGLPQELRPLVEAINQLFTRLAGARQAERAFAANSAHELRTPIAAALAQLHRLRADLRAVLEASPAALTAVTERTEALGRQLQRLHHLCVKLLELSRAEAGVADHTRATDLSQVAHLVLAEFTQPQDASRLRLVLPDRDQADPPGAAGPGVRALGDIDAIGLALRNLVENALLHGGPTGGVTVRVTTTAALEVIDEGPGVPPEQLPHLVQPFQRGNTAAAGHGLGLAIVQALAVQMGGRLDLLSPVTPAGGFLARLQLRPA